MLEPTAAIADAGIPLPKEVGGGAQVPERPARPPAIAPRLKARKSTFACRDRIAKLAG